MPPAIETSGGSAANTVAGVASFGGSVGVHRQGRATTSSGEVFTHDIRAAGVEFDAAGRRRRAEPRTGPLPDPGHPRRPAHDEHLPRHRRRCSARTTSTPTSSPAAQVVYCEGYLWDLPDAKAALPQGAWTPPRPPAARSPSRLSDSFCVDRHRAEFLDLVEDRVDILFANEAEICSLYEIDDVRGGRPTGSRGHCEIACLTRSREGLGRSSPPTATASRCRPRRSTVVDTTGAGDLYAAGLPLRLHPRPRPRGRRPPRRRSPPPRSSATSGPAPRSSSPPCSRRADPGRRRRPAELAGRRTPSRHGGISRRVRNRAGRLGRLNRCGGAPTGRPRPVAAEGGSGAWETSVWSIRPMPSSSRRRASTASTSGRSSTATPSRLHAYLERRWVERRAAATTSARPSAPPTAARRRFRVWDDSARPWLLGVATGRGPQALAHRARASCGRTTVAGRPRSAPAPTTVPRSAEAGADAVLERLAHLAARDRDVTILVAWEDLAPEAIAQALDLARQRRGRPGSRASAPRCSRTCVAELLDIDLRPSARGRDRPRPGAAPVVSDPRPVGDRAGAGRARGGRRPDRARSAGPRPTAAIAAEREQQRRWRTRPGRLGGSRPTASIG